MQKKNIIRKFAAFTVAFTLSVMSVSPVWADTWTKLQDGRLACEDDNGEPVTGWAEYEDDQYYLDKDGIAKTGWIKNDGSWYYLDEDGILVTSDWVDNYYVDSEGRMTKIR